MFFTIKTSCGYQKIKIEDTDTDKTAFVTLDGPTKYTKMVFEMKGAAATFQRALLVIIVLVKWRLTTVYFGNIATFSNTLKEHLKYTDEVLLLLKNAGLTIKLEKCFFFSKTTDYYKNLFMLGCLQVAQKTTEAIKMQQCLATVAEIQTFLGLCNVCLCFVREFVKLSSSLDKKLEKEAFQRFELEVTERSAVDILKENLPPHFISTITLQ